MREKRVFGCFEVAFDVVYLSLALLMSIAYIFVDKGITGVLTGIMGLILVGGDAFHLVPRIAAVLSGNEVKYQRAMGIGKLITSITMTVFYILLGHLGLILFDAEVSFVWTLILYAMAFLRVLLCALPQNKWVDRSPPVVWGIWRNIPFTVMGLMVAILFFYGRMQYLSLQWMWLAIVLSFSFYIPVVLWGNKIRALGMLMLPKTVMYLWMLWMF